MTPARRTLRAIFRALVRLYFRSIEEVGERPSAATGGRVFVSNHWSALIDPILVLTHAPCDISPLAKSTLWNIPGLTWLLDLANAVPVVRRRDDPNKPAGANDEIFERVATHLARGGNVLVFPEGTSHNEPQMQRLKTGAARMLARAAQEGAIGLTFQAVGLEFDERHAFRSRAVVAYGPVRAFDLHGEGAIEAATNQMRADLEEMVVEAGSWEERRLVLFIAELLRNEEGGLSFADAVKLAQGVERARDELRARDPELAANVENATRVYLEALEASGLEDEQLAREGTSARPRRSRLHPLGYALAPLAPVGVVLYWVPYQVPRFVARRTDEIDQHSTLKLGAGLVAYSIWAALLLTAAYFVTPGRAAFALACAVILVSPFVALFWLERTEGFARALRVVTERRRLVELAHKRATALELLGRARQAVEAVGAPPVAP
ncbi:MAG: 1-acyl-sn-glycerol-3-phosphate acyltransferase [Myxococcales bacterium]|nr:1-acyl-sn-glycerol-3-phosphate acyltransferase [Myxococcales bacterium]